MPQGPAGRPAAPLFKAHCRTVVQDDVEGDALLRHLPPEARPPLPVRLVAYVDVGARRVVEQLLRVSGLVVWVQCSRITREQRRQPWGLSCRRSSPCERRWGCSLDCALSLLLDAAQLLEAGLCWLKQTQKPDLLQALPWFAEQLALQ